VRFKRPRPETLKAYGFGRWTRTERDRVPPAGGCYAIFRWTSIENKRDGVPPQLVYIGSANNVRGRLQDFGIGNRWQQPRCHFGQVELISIRVALNRTALQHLTREARLITRLQPPLNRTTWRSAK
jgi:excinuclease UvrABC nuclease subunit